jgi:pimeloyl-ACP methyl ester carboxylesterase
VHGTGVLDQFAQAIPGKEALDNRSARSRTAPRRRVHSRSIHAELLPWISASTLVVRSTGDLVVFFDGGVRLAGLIPAATLVTIEGMGHQPQDPARWQTIADAVITHADR